MMKNVSLDSNDERAPISQTETNTDFLLQKKKEPRNQIHSYEMETSSLIPTTPESRHFNHGRIAHIADKNEEKETRDRDRETERDSLFGIHLARSRPPQTGSVFWSSTPLTTDHDLQDHRTPSKFCSSFSSPPADHG
jgi:hypothetical protein